MIVDAAMRRYALIRLFREIAGGGTEPLGADDLERQWRTVTGLRGTDLTLALQDMLRDQWLEREEIDGFTEYRISLRGAVLMSQSWEGVPWGSWSQRLRLMRARWRRTPWPWHVRRGRRLVDRV
ncbi:hypothetical protein [Solimonas soli]|uniref:hypothetical protein n=1 Tax=Solimonas soli TaxID=413479 RepID=UPI0004819C6A|nr:hypothetical protein [Solimonas soli]